MKRKQARYTGLFSLFILGILLVYEWLSGNMEDIYLLNHLDYSDLNLVMNYTRWVIYVMLIISSIYLLINSSKMNFPIAMFGHTAIEEVILSKIIPKIPGLPLLVWIVFLIIGLGALYVAYSNYFDRKKITIAEFIFNLVVSLFLVTLPLFYL